MAKLDIHIRLEQEEYDKVRLLAYYGNRSKAEIIRLAVQKLDPDTLKKEFKNE